LPLFVNDTPKCLFSCRALRCNEIIDDGEIDGVKDARDCEEPLLDDVFAEAMLKGGEEGDNADCLIVGVFGGEGAEENDTEWYLLVFLLVVGMDIEG